jgi:hypothetical protein
MMDRRDDLRPDTAVPDDRTHDGVDPFVRDARAGGVMRVIAVFGVVVAVVAGVIAWRALGAVEGSVDESLTVGEDAAATLRETIDVADDVIVILESGLGTLDTTLDTLAATVDETAGVAGATAQLAGTLPASLDDVDVALATVEDLGGAIDTTLRALSEVPFGPDYDPDASFPDAISDVRAAFDPLADDLAAISSELDGFAGRSDELEAEIAALGDDLDGAQQALDSSTALLDAYRATADRAGEIAGESRDDLGGSIGWARFAVVLLAALLAGSQFVPWWLGTRLRSAAADVRPSDLVDGADGPDAPAEGITVGS